MKTIVVAFLSFFTVALTPLFGFADGEVNLLSTRQEFLLRPFLDVFERETGIKVNVAYLKKGMLERLKARPGEADLILTKDIANLSAITDAGLLQPYSSSVIDENIPAPWRDADHLWTGLTMRARVFYYSKERVDPKTLTTYLSLADKKYAKKICIRSGYHNYNVALVSAMIAEHGKEKAKAWLEGVKSNLARKPQGNDRAQIRAVSAGECDLAIGNTYYMGKMLENPDQRDWAAAVGIFFPDQEGSGTHVNITGGGITKAAKNKENALKLLEFLSGDLAQTMYSQVNHEYPLKKGIVLSGIVKSFGSGQEGIEKGVFKADTLPMSKIAAHRKDALQLLDEVKFDE
ncbi:MAG: iron ABC transporter substrate-binding protein [Deltaproteobacteria bacterium]|nr:MAG: iron ABC transporter substrate-binding protein [Deltaproteobacteria bacterium]PIE72459.1 MAG: iron ABC transporter substrate-binding protein [Deltaproteobacteria bacterium]